MQQQGNGMDFINLPLERTDGGPIFLLDKALTERLRLLNELRNYALTRPLDPAKAGPALSRLIDDSFKLLQAGELSHGRFTPPEIQKMRVWWLNEKHRWGLTEEDFQRLPPPPQAPKDNPLATVVLVPYLDTWWRTKRAIWNLNPDPKPRHWWQPKEEFKYPPDDLRLFKGVEHEPGLAWVVLNLGANRGKLSRELRVKDLARPEQLPHVEVLAAARLHPEWARQMNGKDVPYVWLPGYEAAITGYGRAWVYVPALHRLNRHRKLVLGNFSPIHPDPSFAAPIILETRRWVAR